MPQSLHVHMPSVDACWRHFASLMSAAHFASGFGRCACAARQRRSRAVSRPCACVTLSICGLSTCGGVCGRHTHRLWQMTRHGWIVSRARELSTLRNASTQCAAGTASQTLFSFGASIPSPRRRADARWCVRTPCGPMLGCETRGGGGQDTPSARHRRPNTAAPPSSNS